VEARSHGERENVIRLVDTHEAESLLIPLAYWLQRTQPSGTASKVDIQNALTNICLEDEGINPSSAQRTQIKSAEERSQKFLAEMREMSGLIVERGYDAFGFLHLTFQEYFAGRALAKMDPNTRWDEVRTHLHEPRWREPILLCAGQLGVVEKRRDVVSEFVGKILTNDDPTENDIHRNLLLALSIACDDVNLEHTLLNNIVQKAMACLQINVYVLASELINKLGQLIVNGIASAEACLLLLANSKDTQLQLTAIDALMECVEHPGIRQAILQRLDDQHWQVRRSAVNALATLISSDADVRQAILQRLDDQDEYVRRSAVNALATLISSDADVRQAILQRLDDQDWQVRSSAFIALSKIEKLGIFEKNIRQELINWLGVGFDERYVPIIDEKSYWLAQERFSYLFGENLPGDQSLYNKMLDWLKNPRWQTRLGAVRTLLQWPGRPPREILKNIIEALNDNRGLESYPARLAAASYLVNRDPYSKDAIQLGLEALEYGNLSWEYIPESREVRKQAALLLGTLEPIRYDPIVYDKLLQAMKTDQDSGVRDTLYSVLVKLAGSKSFDSQQEAGE
jgi:HEAT repeat protein